MCLPFFLTVLVVIFVTSDIDSITAESAAQVNNTALLEDTEAITAAAKVHRIKGSHQQSPGGDEERVIIHPGFLHPHYGEVSSHAVLDMTMPSISFKKFMAYLVGAGMGFTAVYLLLSKLIKATS
ncbi:hypothetical protein PRNP1_012447 [Phytophthora ramorum]